MLQITHQRHLLNGATGFSREAVVELSRIKAEPDWMLAFRLAAWDTYVATPSPTLYDEEWRRTDLRHIPFETVLPYATSEAVPADPAQGRAGQITQTDSEVTSVHLIEALAAQGVIVLPLDQAVRERPDLVQRHFMTTAITPHYSKFAALHAAFWSGGVFIYVPRNTEVALPIQATVRMVTDGVALFPHTLIIADEGSSVTYIDEHMPAASAPTSSTPSLCIAATEIVLQRGARVRYNYMQEWGTHVSNFSIQRMVLNRDTQMNSLVASMGSGFSKLNVDSILQGEGAQTEMLGLIFGDGAQFIDHHTLQDHIVPHTTSDLLYKGVLSDTARSVYSGLIRVHEKAQRTDAYQANRNLLLSKSARADSIPNLEIAANDVRCTHGATVGQVEAEQVYYLMARGIPREVAAMMIVQGFCEPVIERVPLLDVQERLRDHIRTKMHTTQSFSFADDREEG